MILVIAYICIPAEIRVKSDPQEQLINKIIELQSELNRMQDETLKDLELLIKTHTIDQLDMKYKEHTEEFKKKVETLISDLPEVRLRKSFCSSSGSES